MTLKGAGEGSKERHRDNLRTLTERKDTLESELSELNADFALEQKRRRVEPETLAKLLPEGSALVDIVRVRSRYLAFILSSGGKPVLVDLGKAKPIEQAVAEWRETLARSTALMGRLGESQAEQQLSAKGRALY